MRSKNETFALIKDSLDEAQISVRAYDTKAQIVGVGYIFALSVIGDIGDLATHQQQAGLAAIVAGWFIVITPIALFGYVLYPARKSMPREASDGRKHIFYLHPERYGSSDRLIEAVESCDPVDEIAQELIQLALLRESKRKRFVTALVSAACAFVILFAAQIAMSLGAV